jgi:hypothetical protein
MCRAELEDPKERDASFRDDENRLRRWRAAAPSTVECSTAAGGRLAARLAIGSSNTK